MSEVVTKFTGVTDVVTFTPHGEDTNIELSIALVKRFLTTPTAKGAKPTDEDVVKFMMHCHAMKLNPWIKDCYLAGYDTSASGPKFDILTAHQVLLKRAESCPEYEGMESGVVIQNATEIVERAGDIVPKGYTLIGGWAKVYRSDRRIPMYKSIPLDAFDKDNAFWKGGKKGMQIAKCAEADALRSAIPSLSGLRSEVERQYSDDNAGNVSVIKTLHGKIDAQIAGESENGNGHAELEQREVESLQLRLTELMKGLSNEEITSLKLDKAIERAGGIENLNPKQIEKAVEMIEKHNAAKAEATK